MRVIVAGLGVQGRKRKRFAGGDYVASVDPVGDEADYKNLRDVPLDRYDAVLACIPDEPKLDLVRSDQPGASPPGISPPGAPSQGGPQWRLARSGAPATQ